MAWSARLSVVVQIEVTTKGMEVQEKDEYELFCQHHNRF